MADDRSAALRAAFDRSFAEPRAPDRPPTHDFLLVRVGGEPYALALAEVASLHADVSVMPVPSPAPELLGIASIRSMLAPIYDLRVAIHVPTTGAPRWSVMVRDATAGFAFDGFDGHARSVDRGAAIGDAGRTLVTIDGRLLPVVALRAVLAEIQGRSTIAGRGTAKEP